MKTFLILCVVLVARIHAEFVSPFPMEYDQVVDACRIETGYTDEVVAKEEESYFSENGGLRLFNYCFLDKTGFVSRDGKINVDNALAKLTPGLLKDLVENCNSRKKENPKSIFAICFHRGVSIYKRFSEFNSVIRAFEKNLTQIVDACRMETGYTDEVIAEEEKSDLNKDVGLKKFNYCFLEKTGFEGDEKFNIDDALAEIPQTNVTEIIEHCQSLTTKKIIPHSVLYFSACLHLGVSDYIRFTEVWSSRYSENRFIVQILDACNKETRFIDEIPISKITYYYVAGRNFTELKGLRRYNDCFLEKSGIITSDGKLNIDAALANIKPQVAKPMIEHCQANIILKYIKESVHDFSTCYHHGVQSEIKDKFGFTDFWNMRVSGTTFANKYFTMLYFDHKFIQSLSNRAGILKNGRYKGCIRKKWSCVTEWHG